MFSNVNDDVKALLLAGIGAVALTAEKSKEAVEEFVKKGQLTVSKGKVLNEELKHNLQKKGEQVVAELGKDKPVTAEAVVKSLDKMSPEELAAIRAKLEEVEKDDGSKQDGSAAAE